MTRKNMLINPQTTLGTVVSTKPSPHSCVTVFGLLQMIKHDDAAGL